MVQFLVQGGYLKQDQLEEAQRVQRQTNEPDIGRVLINLGMVGEKEVVKGRAQEAGIPFVDIDNLQIDSSALNVVPDRLAKQHSVIPVRKEGTVLWLAMANHNNIEATDAVRFASGCLVRPVLAVPGAIEDAIRKYYSGGGGAAVSAAATPAVAIAKDAEKETSKPGGLQQNVSGLIAQAQIARDAAGPDDEGGGDGEELAEQAPIIRLANTIIKQAINDRASDIHVEPQQRALRIRYRIDGVMMEAMTVPKNLQAPLVSRLKIMADMNIAERRVPQDGRIEIRDSAKEFDLRVSTIPTPFGEKVVMRILDKGSAMIGLAKLGFLPENQAKIEELVSQPNGMFLCTGPTGSGKTTTQYSVLHMLNSIERNIITVEDPVEYQLNGLSQVGVNKKAGLTFANALRAFLRQDPDIIMVGEIRDLETGEIAIEAALTGHLVLSTLHTNDAPSCALRLIDMGIEPYLIAATLIGVLAQRLGRRIDQDHKEPYTVKAIELKRFGFNVVDPDEDVTLYRGIPNDGNRMTGYRGRMGLHELMTLNAETAELIVRRAPLNDLKMAAKANGMRELREDGLEKVLAGVTTPDEVMRVVFTAGF
jgi:type IV pilus assembly protein PilB